MKTIFLIPPSEGKNSDDKINKKFKDVFSDLSFENLNIARKEIINYLGKMDFNEKNLEKMTGLKGRNIEDAYKMNKNIMESKVKKAIDLFDGVMYKSIDYSQMNEESKEYFENNIVIFNALLGINSPKDLIPEFKVKPEGYLEGKKIYKFWKERLSNVFDEYMIFDLLTSNYRKMFDNKNYYKIDFYANKNGDIKSAGHISKKFRGQFIKNICDNKINSLESILKIKTENLELFDYDEKNKEIKFKIKD